MGFVNMEIAGVRFRRFEATTKYLKLNILLWRRNPLNQAKRRLTDYGYDYECERIKNPSLDETLTITIPKFIKVPDQKLEIMESPLTYSQFMEFWNCGPYKRNSRYIRLFEAKLNEWEQSEIMKRKTVDDSFSVPFDFANNYARLWLSKLTGCRVAIPDTNTWKSAVSSCRDKLQGNKLDLEWTSSFMDHDVRRVVQCLDWGQKEPACGLTDEDLSLPVRYVKYDKT